MEPNEINIDVKNCARCHGDHNELRFTKLDNAADEYKYWCMCPTKEQPILLAMKEV